MELWLIQDGLVFTLYSMSVGESVADFLTELERDEPKEWQRMIRRLDQLANVGPTRREDEFNNLGGGLFEAKTRSGARIVFFYDEGHVVICALGFMKKSQRTPGQQLEAARNRKTMYEQSRDQKQSPTVLYSETQQPPRRMPSWWK